MTRSYFSGGVSEQDNIQKVVSKGWCKESRCWCRNIRQPFCVVVMPASE